MKKIILLGAMIIISSFAFAQAPQGISYQAVARTNAGLPIGNTTLATVEFKIYNGDPNNSGLLVCTDTHTSVPTNQFGLFTRVIGTGSGSSCFPTIPWGTGNIWLQVSIDAGFGLVLIGTQQFMSVPYALYSPSSAGPTGATGITGATGPTGNNGTVGSTGPTGAGAQGPQGIPGVTGSTGPTGAGIQGVTGATGPTGNNGTNGTNGSNGATGPTGANGTNGSNGVTGPTGLAGTNGTNGTNGVTGATGPTGNNGTNGTTGPTGNPGGIGPPGPTGNPGGMGPSGPPGPTGPSGSPGTMGPTGNPGATGATGVTGPSGSANAWALLGSAGTVDGTNFIGTTDNVPFNIKVNNQKSGRIDNVNANTFFGYQSGNLISSGYGNSANGLGTLSANSTGNYNTANGMVALYSNTSGSNNTATGQNSLNANTVGSSNTAAGMYALFSNVAGSNGTAIGYNAMYNANNTATAFNDYNVAVGFEALKGSATPANNTGNQNTSIGAQSLWSNTTGSSIVSTGFQALYSNTTGNWNTANGQQTLFSNTTGASNSAFGLQSLWTNTTGNANTGLGYQSGYLNSTGSGNVFLGFKAGYNETGSNKLYIANSGSNPPLIYGDFSLGNVGIGNTIPQGKLDILSANGFGNDLRIQNTAATGSGINLIGTNRQWMVFASSPSAPAGDQKLVFRDFSAGTDRMVIDNVGNVGIGTTTPGFALNVSSIFQTGIQFDGSDPAYAGIYMNASNTLASSFYGYKVGGTIKAYEYVNNNSDWNLFNGSGTNLNVNGTTGNFQVTNFTQLGGATAPLVKMKKLTGTSPGLVSSSISIPHGLNAAKILSVSVFIEYSGPTLCVPPSYSATGGNYYFDYYITGTDIVIATGPTASAILTKPVRILVTYEQ